MRVAFLGLGIMGRSMARIWSRPATRSRSGIARLPRRTAWKARAARHLRRCRAGAEVVWMCVSDTKAVESVLFGPEGAAHALAADAIIADSSTISPSATCRFAERLKARGIDYVDAPMTGSKIAPPLAR